MWPSYDNSFQKSEHHRLCHDLNKFMTVNMVSLKSLNRCAVTKLCAPLIHRIFNAKIYVIDRKGVWSVHHCFYVWFFSSNIYSNNLTRPIQPTNISLSHWVNTWRSHIVYQIMRQIKQKMRRFVVCFSHFGFQNAAYRSNDGKWNKGDLTR